MTRIERLSYLIPDVYSESMEESCISNDLAKRHSEVQLQVLEPLEGEELLSSA